MKVFEICSDSVDSAIAAERGGAHRIELCSDLMEGGITPGPGLISVVRSRISIDIYVMVRPRGGDFIYTDDEFEVMLRDIDESRRLGANGFVLGLLDEHGRVDAKRTRELVERARPLPVTFHRAIDMTPDPVAALEDVIAAGAQRVLTSGGAADVVKGSAALRKMHEAAANRIAIMAGGGLTLKTLPRVVEATGITEFHASLRKIVQSPAGFHKQGMAMGDVRDHEYLRYTTHEEDVRAMVDALKAVSSAEAARSVR